ncbi:uncharacterized protein LOC135846964 [Planococcus citri]|uniref:uncharacterized protein LOC135846964 n=1 Tax=Planococcus citri TaxID=170843 RepID=UPI0031F80C72
MAKITNPNDDNKSDTDKEQPTPHAVNAIHRIELPAFNGTNIRLWWRQVELGLGLGSFKNEKTKFDAVAGSLPHDIATNVQEVIFNPPSNNPFTALRDCVYKVYEPSDTEQINCLLEGCQLCDKKPSVLLAEMRVFAKGRVTNDTLSELFKRRIPEPVQLVLAARSVTDPDKMAQAADAAIQYVRAPSVVAVAMVGATSALSSAAVEQNLLLGQISALTKPVNTLVNEGREHRSRSRNCSDYHSIEFLGYNVDEAGIRPSPSRVEPIVNYPKPSDVSGLR